MRALKGASFALLVLGVGLMFPLIGWLAGFEARSFSIDSIHVDAVVRRDGSMLVSEEVTYTFRGADSQPFTVGTRSFESNVFPWQITSIQAFEDGEPRRTLLSTRRLFEWDIAPARSGTRTYQLVYEVDGAVQVWADTAELYWNWIGTTSPEVGQWSALVRFPSGGGELRAWAHGPLDGVLRVDADTVRSATAAVPEGQFVDNRIIADTDRFDVTPASVGRLDTILAEERELAEEANRARDRAARIEDLRRTAERWLSVLMGPLIMLAVGGFLWVWDRWGKDPPRPDDIGDYWREVPDDPPAVAAALLKWRRVDSEGYSATIMDLARRGHLEIEEITKERLLRSPTITYRFVRTSPSQPDPLLTFESRALKWIFRGGATSVTQDELIEYAKANESSASTFWTGFQSDVVEELDRRNYLVRGKGLAFTLHALIVVALASVAILALVVGALVAGIVGLVAAAVLAPLGILHRSRTPAGTRRDTEWRALQRYLRDFSRLDEAPAGHLALWDHYLVAATALGVAAELLEGLRTRFPEVIESASFAPWYHASPGSSGTLGIASFGSTFGTAAVSSFTPSSSSSGGGGGFSSGGGGGGGGGGFGAR